MEKSKIFFENDSACVYYDENLDALFLQYKSKVKTMDEFILINGSVVQAFKQLNTTNLIADIRKMGIISLDAQDWVLNNLFPPVLEHLNGKKLFHAQLLDPSEIMSKVAASNLRKKTSAIGFTIEQFGDEQSLIEKLQSLKKPMV
ncbi:hypothetical protein [Marivirga arenosa]|uniref:Uncharacterized protein n=1 Tax=Marivirga arenosa TaxID=3059076 RepID=A0AA49GGK7_9BACT|nr:MULTISPECIES: hypothetical protein [unclassified Marivirga]WKK81994.1 hypothetical protein QYS47_07450 [Marivirga sp. BKB1-2]WKK87309.2 hypothetical protein QYS48_11315 [Marivirga sp. ABR2-2]